VRIADCDGTCFEIDLAPAQACDFAGSHSAAVEKADKESVADGGSCFDEPGDFVGGKDAGEMKAGFWSWDGTGPVAIGEFVEYGSKDGDIGGEPGGGGLACDESVYEGGDFRLPNVDGRLRNGDCRVPNAEWRRRKG